LLLLLKMNLSVVIHQSRSFWMMFQRSLMIG